MIGYREYGDPNGFPVLFHHGVPGSSLYGLNFPTAASDAFLQGIQVVFAYFMSVFRDWEFELRQVEKKVVDSVAFMDDYSLFLHIDSKSTRFGPVSVYCVRYTQLQTPGDQP